FGPLRSSSRARAIRGQRWLTRLHISHQSANQRMCRLRQGAPMTFNWAPECNSSSDTAEQPVNLSNVTYFGVFSRAEQRVLQEIFKEIAEGAGSCAAT